jgi:hypothetical protein
MCVPGSGGGYQVDLEFSEWRRRMKPDVADLYCGLFGWGAGFVSEGYRVIGFDLEQRGPVPEGCELVLQDVLTIHGSELVAKIPNLLAIVASPPCTEYSYMAMPWQRAKQIARALRGQGEFPRDYTGSRTIAELNALFDACFRIQREASEAAGRYIPLVVENVCGAQKWVGQARWHYGSFYLWGDVPALMPRRNGDKGSHLTSPRENANAVKGMSGVRGFSHPGSNGKNKSDLGGPNDPRRFNSKSSARKQASAEIAKIPFPLAQHIAHVYAPQEAAP